MWARKRIDIGWSDLAAAIASLARPRSAEVAAALEDAWDTNTVACLSVRSGLDLVLQALKLPAGSEVLVSAITIPDMVTILQEHGLVPVPIDLCPRDLSVDLDSLATAITDRTRMILVAHLFGSVMPMQPVIDLAQEQGLLVFEDCAQAFCGNQYKGDPASDFVAFSFGPIKTATALGGGLVSVQDDAVLMRMRQAQADYPVQSRFDFAKRIVRYSLLKLLGTRICFRLLALACRVFGQDLDQVVGASAKNFRSGQLVARLRRQPATALLRLLLRRLQRFDVASLDARAACGRQLVALLGSDIDCVGVAHDSTHWVLAVRSSRPRALVNSLQAHGFDGTVRSSLRVLTMVGARSPSAPAAEALLPELVFVPAYPGMPQHELERVAKVIQRTETPPTHTGGVTANGSPITEGTA